MDLSRSEDPRLHAFAGKVVYRTVFTASKAHEMKLDLGKVHGVSEVNLNGRPLGERWWGAHVYEAGDALRSGRNVLEVKVATVLFNYCRSLHNPVAKAWARGDAPAPVGLVGPVRFYPVKYDSR